MSIAASKLQQRRRDQERVLHATQSFLEDHHNTAIIHDWERRTEQQIEQREVNAITRELLRQDEEELRQRKKEVQSLFEGEMSQWKRTLQSSLEVTQEEKMERIRRRAYELKEKREAERQNVVKECYERQWRDACDDLRAIDSKATLDRIMIDRELMIKSRAILKEEERQLRSQNEAHYMSLINKDESEGQSQRRQSSLEIKRTLDCQVQKKRTEDETAMTQRRHEEQDELRRLAHLEQKAQESARLAKEKASEDGEDMLNAMQQRARKAETRREEEKKQNLILLQHASSLGLERMRAERTRKQGDRDAAAEYVRFLQEEAKLEEEKEKALDVIREAESRRITQLNDNKLTAEAETKRRWRAQVDITRQEQIRSKRAEAEASQRAIDQEVINANAALRRAEESDKRDAEKAQATRMKTMLANKVTIDKRAKDAEECNKEKFLLRQKIENDQRDFNERVEAQRKKFGVSDLI